MPLEKSFDATKAEARIYRQWESSGAFRAGANSSRDETFTIMIPPPNVTGALHVGHAFNNTLQDILIRWHRMRGFDTLWQPGQDHAGIATQLQVEKMLTETQQPGRRDLGREKFLEKVWEWKARYGDTIINQQKRLGCSCDWSRNAFTMSGAPGSPAMDAKGNFHDAVIKVFVEMHKQGLIYHGKRLTNWDPHFETAISDLEVENSEVDGHMWHFKYPLADGQTYTYVEKDEDGNITLEEERDYISIATTRPETMLGDGAVAVHPSDERYAPIVGKLCEIPVGPKEFRRLIPIIADEYPDPEFGSGAVKITGAHDFNDYEVAKRGGIPMYRLMDVRGHMRADGVPYAEAAGIAQSHAKGADFTEASVDAVNLVPDDLRGLDRFEARKLVVEQITSEGLAVMVSETYEDEDGNEQTRLVPYVENKKIMQPFGDRSGVVVEPMLTDQWFVDAARVVAPALDAVRTGKTKIIPESGEKIYYNWLENIEPWCISRQLWWGHQIPVWYGPDGKHFCAENEQAARKAAQDHYGDTRTILFSQMPIAEQLGEAADHLIAKGQDISLENPEVIKLLGGQPIILDRDPDVLDTWFSSGLWPIGTLGWPEETPELAKYFPTDVLVTGFDILFFWVARMMMMQLAVVDNIPFHTVYLHQLVRDEKGQKMSKTKGNVTDPLEIVDEFGADALRFAMAQMAAIGGVLKLSTDRIKGYRNFGTKLWNAARFAEMNGALHGAEQIPTAQATVNKWIIGETARVREAVDKSISEYRFNDAANALYAFVWGKVCDWYVELSKPLLQGQDSEAKLETQNVMGWVIDQCLILLHPIMPYITEELWGTLSDRHEMLVHRNWPDYTSEIVDVSADREMTWVISLIEDIRSARQQVHVPVGAYLPLKAVDMTEEARAAWTNNSTMIKRLARIEEIEEIDAFPKGCITVAANGAQFGIPLEGVIDIAEEIARLEKTLGKLSKEIGGLRGRLNNPKFAQNAPDEVVQETRENLTRREDDQVKLKAALARLVELG